jgi:hypothetical protein
MIQKKLSIIFIFLILISCFSVPSIEGNNINNNNFKQINYILTNNSEPFNGYTLFSPEYSTKTFIIDINGNIVHSWDSNYIQGLPVYLLENGDLIRGCSNLDNTRFLAGGFTGRVEIYDWNNSLIWDFDYSTDRYCLHHDIEVLPNKNILMISWEYKTASEAVAAGRNPNNIQNGQLWPDKIIEIKPIGPSESKIVWEWHVWDHLIQDFDSSKDNYGVVADHPELIDINTGGRLSDFNHINSIDYNQEFDQILLSSHNQNEIWVIDHSTTTEEAADHTGGKYGKGGDLLYRWGNPRMYKTGGFEDQQLFGQHDAQWIELGCPGEGNILIFNNGQGRPDGKFSSIVEIQPPVNGTGYYDLTFGSSYMPTEPIWLYTAENPGDFFAPKISGAQRLPNGNTLICMGDKGFFFEVTLEKETVWEYENTYPNTISNNVFKIRRYGLDYPGLFSLFQNPEKPNTPNGPTSGEAGKKYSYTTNANDPEDDQLYYWFDWGDDTNSKWFGPYDSGDIVTASHVWDSRGNFEIRVKVKDIHGLESDWSDPLVVSMPKNKLFIVSIIKRLMERFPINVM